MAKGRAEMAEIREYQKETARQMRETDRRLKKAEDLFTSQWGKLMESLVEGDLVPLLKQRGIEVERTLQRMTGRRNGEQRQHRQRAGLRTPRFRLTPRSVSVSLAERLSERRTRFVHRLAAAVEDGGELEEDVDLAFVVREGRRHARGLELLGVVAAFVSERVELGGDDEGGRQAAVVSRPVAARRGSRRGRRRSGGSGRGTRSCGPWSGRTRPRSLRSRGG